MRVGIHQPNYLPWVGYFNKMKDCDVFVIFDDVQLPTGRNFETRSLIKTNQGMLWLTIPIKGRNNYLLIRDAEFADNYWKAKHLKSIQIAYAKAPFFKDYIGDLEDIYNVYCSSLRDFNIMLIEYLAGKLGIKPQFVKSSTISSGLRGEEKILEIIKSFGADEYISGTGTGSKRYIREEDFEKANVKLIWQDFQNTVYPQLHGKFVPKLSVIDLLFNAGPGSYKYL